MTERLLRTGLLVLLAALTLAAPWWDRQASRGGPVRLDGPLTAGALRAILRSPPPVVVRGSAAAPTAAEMALLEAAAVRAPLLVALPAAEPALHADPPIRPRAGRTAAIRFQLRGRAGDTARVRLQDRVGTLDSAVVVLDSAGQGSGGFRIRPRNAGWHEWTLVRGAQRRTVGAWADSASPPRVLVHAGTPGWEAKFVTRALEESGARVMTRYDLGRGMTVDAGADGLTAAGLRRTDVVLVLDGAPMSGGQGRLLREWAEAGGGVLLAGDRAAGLSLAASSRGPLPLRGNALAWRLPPELAPLPPAPVRAAQHLLVPADGAEALAGSAEGAVLLARPLGAGQVAALGIPDSWRWRLEAGRVAEHREFWRSLADYLAGRGAGPVLTATPSRVAPGAAVEITVWAPAGAAPATARAIGPDGAVYPIELRPEGAGLARGRFHPPAAGVYRVEAGGSATGFRADGAAPAGWAPVSLLADRSGGAAVPADSAEVVLRRLAPAGDLDPRRRRWVILLAVVLLAGAGWAVRRLAGRP